MKKRLLTLFIAGITGASLLSGCAKQNNAEPAAEAAVEAPSGASDAASEEPAGEEVSDQEAADNVAALIDAIYVQQRTDKTDEQCKAAKEAWDALTDAQKELVEGQFADPDYFGLDTGDASKDDPLNSDGIGENEILVVSFGTSFNDSRTEDIGGIEKAIIKANPDWDVRRAFTAQIIINHIQARDGIKIDNMDQALERAVSNNVKNLLIQPTHLMQGAEYDELMESLNQYASSFESIKIGLPLLGSHAEDPAAVNADKKTVATAVVDASIKDAGFDSAKSAADAGTAFVLMGHGTSHNAKVTYTQMQAQMQELGYDNVFVGTVEGEPEETSCEAIIEAASNAGFKDIILRPLMVVAGDHANNDMAGDDEDSWKSMFTASGKFESVGSQIHGLGSIPEVQEVYVSHVKEAQPYETGVIVECADYSDGEYKAAFNTDSGMFHVNDALDGMGDLTIKDGKMMLHVSLTSKNILNLYPGLAANAENDKAGILEPTIDTVTYSDGTTEEVHGFDVPVPALDTEFDLALLGTKGKWYDHKVSVSIKE